MRFKKGDKVYWDSAPSPEEHGFYAACLTGVQGIITRASYGSYDVLFPGDDYRWHFLDDDLISEEHYNSPLAKALR